MCSMQQLDLTLICKMTHTIETTILAASLQGISVCYYSRRVAKRAGGKYSLNERRR